VTLTLAELYLKQGLAGRAREILRKLADEGNEAARERLLRIPPPASREIALLEGLLGAAPVTARRALMGFREDLEGICGRVEGALGATLMGFDGIAIETAELKAPEGVELQSLLVEYSGILSQVQKAAESLRMGTASEVSIRTEKLVAVARPLTPDYFVLLAVSPDGNIGRARYELRVAGPKLAAQL
jgi:predicted regulator of Ras-like GTPase activity (Roadblock/LC7/MglB family)